MKTLELRKQNDLIEGMNDEDLFEMHHLVECTINTRIRARQEKGYMPFNAAKKIVQNRIAWLIWGATTEKYSKEIYEKWWDFNKTVNELRGLPRNPEEAYSEDLSNLTIKK